MCTLQWQSREQVTEKPHEGEKYIRKDINSEHISAHDYPHQDQRTIAFHSIVESLLLGRQEREEDLGAVQRGNREHIEYRQNDIDLNREYQHPQEHPHKRCLEIQTPAGAKVDAQDQTEEERRKQVGKRSGEGDPHHVPFGIVKVVGIDRHRAGPAETDEDQHYRAEDVQMNQGVQRKPTHHLGGGVAATISYVAVRELVNGDGEKKAGNHYGYSLETVHRQLITFSRPRPQLANSTPIQNPLVNRSPS